MSDGSQCGDPSPFGPELRDACTHVYFKRLLSRFDSNFTCLGSFLPRSFSRSVPSTRSQSPPSSFPNATDKTEDGHRVGVEVLSENGPKRGRDTEGGGTDRPQLGQVDHRCPGQDTENTTFPTISTEAEFGLPVLVSWTPRSQA